MAPTHLLRVRFLQGLLYESSNFLPYLRCVDCAGRRYATLALRGEKMKKVFRVSIAWQSAIRPSGAPDFATEKEAIQWIEAHPFSNSLAGYEIRKLWVASREQNQ